MNELEVLNELKESLIFETAWLYESSDGSNEEKDKMLESTKTIWNRSIQRSGLNKYTKELSVSIDDFKNNAERVWCGDDK